MMGTSTYAETRTMPMLWLTLWHTATERLWPLQSG